MNWSAPVPRHLQLAKCSAFHLGGCGGLHSVSRMLTDKPWRAQAVAQLLMAAAVCLVLSSFWLASDPDSVEKPTGVLRILGATLTSQGAVLVMLWILSRKHAISLPEAFGLNLRPGRAVLIGVVVGLGFVPAAWGMQAAILEIAKLLHIHLPEQDAVALLRLAEAWPDRIALGFMAIIAAPLAEEGLFRGVLFPAIRRYGFPNAAMWLTSLAFAAIHGNALIFIPLVVLAVVLALLYERTGNLLSSISCHATFNAINFVMLFAAKYFEKLFEKLPS